jgi:hypothetical protein
MICFKNLLQNSHDRKKFKCAKCPHYKQENCPDMYLLINAVVKSKNNLRLIKGEKYYEKMVYN